MIPDRIDEFKTFLEEHEANIDEDLYGALRGFIFDIEDSDDHNKRMTMNSIIYDIFKDEDFDTESLKGMDPVSILDRFEELS